jgi:hypothetical protein
VESGIAQRSQARPKHETGLCVCNSNQDGWRLMRAPRRNAEIKKPGVCHREPEPERFPQGMEAGTQTLERKISNGTMGDIVKSYLKNNL